MQTAHVARPLLVMRIKELWVAVSLAAALPILSSGAAERLASMRAGICQWPDGKKAAVSLRFDDSHPTHVTVCVPLLNAHGLVGTFLICPGNDGYRRHAAAWEKDIPQAGHELGNHTMHHRGARTDAEAEAEIGLCAEQIRRIAPQQGRLLQFQAGGGTHWMMRKPWTYFAAKYDLLLATGGRALSCAESYSWFSPEAFARHLREAIARGDWLAPYFHNIGQGGLAISEQAFTAVLREVAAHRDEIWCAGMSRIQRYRTEREQAHLSAYAADEDTVVLRLVATTDAALYDVPLSLELTIPPGIEGIRVAQRGGGEVPWVLRGEGAERRAIFAVPPVDGVYEARAAGLGAAWRAARGGDIAPPPEHPWLFFTSADRAALRAKRDHTMAREMWEAFLDRAEAIRRRPPTRPDRSSDSWDRARSAAERLRTLAFAYAMTDDRAYVARALPEIEAILAAPSWSDPRHKAVADLVSAETTWNLALGYDWMYDALGKADRQRMREAIVHRGLEPIYDATGKGVWWARWPRGNWGGVILGKAGTAAMAVLRDEPRAAEWIRIARDKMLHYVEALGPDGGWGEGPSYAAYCWFNVIQFFDALARIAPESPDVLRRSNLGQLPYYYLHLRRPDGKGFVPFANVGTSSRLVSPFLYRIAAARADQHAQWIAQEITDRSVTATIFGFLWCDPELKPREPTDAPTARWFRDIDWAVVRSGWKDAQARLFAFKGGQKDWDHYHEDINSFVLFAYGQPLITDLYYPHQIWAVRTEAHNTIMVNEREQLGGAAIAGNRSDPRYRGVLGGVLESPWYARLVGDASMTYRPADVKSFVREVICLRQTGPDQPADYYLVFDDVVATGPVPMDWHLHTFGRMTLDDRRLEIVQGDAAADVTLLAPPKFDARLLAKSFDQEGIRKPFPSATADTFLKLRPEPLAPRHVFLVAIQPRPAERSASGQVTAIRAEDLVGARRVEGRYDDVALFATEQPEIAAEGISALGRTCFVRRGPQGPAGAALHAGSRLAVDGQQLLASDYAGDLLATFGQDVIEVVSRPYDTHWIEVFSPRRPAGITVNGRDRPVVYDAARRVVRIEGSGPSRIRIRLP